MFFFDDLLHLSPCSSDNWGRDEDPPMVRVMNTASGLVVPTKPPSRLTAVIVCPPPQPRPPVNKKKLDPSGKMTQEMFPCLAQPLIRRWLHDHASLNGGFWTTLTSLRRTRTVQTILCLLRSHVLQCHKQTLKSCQPVVPWQDERVKTVREEPNLQPVFYLRDVTDGTRSLGM